LGHRRPGQIISSGQIEIHTQQPGQVDEIKYKPGVEGRFANHFSPQLEEPETQHG